MTVEIARGGPAVGAFLRDLNLRGDKQLTVLDQNSKSHVASWLLALAALWGCSPSVPITPLIRLEPLVVASSRLPPEKGGYASSLIDAEQSYSRSRARLRLPLDSEERKAALIDREQALQRLAVARSWIADYDGAISAMNELRGSHPLSSEGRAKYDRVADEVMAKHAPVPAIAAIVKAAAERQIVILNEGHHLPRHRAFAHQLAMELGRLGFEYLACEAFFEVDGLIKRGYPTAATGYYVQEPLFADFVRESVKNGFKAIAYEFTPTENFSALDQIDRINEREKAQAKNLFDQVFAKNPKAKVFIYVGYSHILKNRIPSKRHEGRWIQWMGGRLKEITGLDPLTIDQTVMTDPSPSSPEYSLWRKVFGENRFNGPLVLRSQTAPKSYSVVGQFAGDADMQVFHPPSINSKGRPDWLAMGGYRTPYEIPRLPGRKLVQAFRSDESDEWGSPIPMDQIMTDDTPDTSTVLMLPRGSFRFVIQDVPHRPAVE